MTKHMTKHVTKHLTKTGGLFYRFTPVKYACEMLGDMLGGVSCDFAWQSLAGVFELLEIHGDELNMDLQLYEAEDVVSRRHGGKRAGARYANYSKAIQPHLKWLNDQIEASKDGAIRVKLDDFAKATGFKMQKVTEGKVVENSPGLNPTSLGWGFKYSLFHAGITYNMGKVEDGQPVMIMRKKVEGDVLPASLQDKKPAAGAEIEDEKPGEDTGTA